MCTLRRAALLALILAACGDRPALTTTAATTTEAPDSSSSTSAAPVTTTTDTPTSTGSSTHGESTQGVVSATDTSSESTSGTIDSLSTSSSASGTSPGDTSTGDTSSGGTASASTGDDGTTTSTTEDVACLAPTDSDTAADPAAWSLDRDQPLGALSARALAVAPTGTVVFATIFNGALDLGDGPMDAGNDNHWAFASHDASGALQWSDHIGGDGSDDHTETIDEFAMAIDCAGNLVIGGGFYGHMTLQDKQLTAVEGSEINDDLVVTTQDMFLAKYGPDGALHWARRFGDDRYQRIHDLDVQADGTIVIAGAAEGTLELGGPPIVGGDRYVGVLAAFDPGGGPLWQRSYASSADTAVYAIDVGPGDRLTVAGRAAGDTDFGGGPVLFADDPSFIAQFEPDGAHRWSRRFIQSHSPTHIGSDEVGGVVFSGDFYPGNLVFDGYVARFDDTGTLLWTRSFDPDPQTFESVVTGGLAVGDEIVLAGRFLGSIDFGGGLLISDPLERTLFVARYDLTGAHLASSMFDGVGEASVRAAASGPDGEVVLGGEFDGTLDLGAGPMVSVDGQELFVHRFSP